MVHVMSEVKRYLIQKTPIGIMMKENPEGNWVAADDLDAQRLRADTAEAELRTEKLRADTAVGDAKEAERKIISAEQRNAALIGWRDPEFTWATIEASNKAKMQALGHDMDCFSTPIYGPTALPAITEERREYEVTELAEFMSNLSGGLRHFAGYMIDAGWRKPTALNQKSEGESHDAKPAIGSVVVVHGGIKAFVKAHHKDGLIVGAGDGHLVTEWSKP